MKRSTKAHKTQTVSLLDNWRSFLAPHVTRSERRAQGKKMRELCPRTSHSEWAPPKQRVSPLKLLALQDKARVDHLIPLRYGRMMRSSFAFYRGNALIMANDLAGTPRTEIFVQLSGDCHLSNFGLFATPERNVIFDLNDFDETLPGPFEWDLKRLAASFVVAAENNGFTQSVSERCVRAVVRVYRRKMQEYSQMNTLDVWYERVDWEHLVERIKKPGSKQTAFADLSRLKEKRSHAGAVSKLTELVDGKRRIKDEVPYVYHPEIATAEAVKALLQAYAGTTWDSRRRLLERYRFVDVAAKVVGVGSVGTAAAVVLLQGEGGPDDYIFLQVKEANPSVLERYLGRSQFRHPGQRIVNGQRMMQSASDLFLGWTSGEKKDFYIRQLMDMKASVPVDELDAVTLEQYAEVCAYALARAHARTGDPVLIDAYLGKSDTFEEALVQFATAYKKQNDRDYGLLIDAIDKGQIPATPGL